eukprot:scaffold4002_cov123-Isochrysis_galbana.AAC.5
MPHASQPLWDYELYGGAQLAPHRLYVFARFLTPPKGVWEGPRALVHLPRNTRCRFLFPPPCAFLFLASSPRAWEVSSVLVFVLNEIAGSPNWEGLCHAPGSYKSRHSRVGTQVLMNCAIASTARRSAVPLPAPGPGDRPARHKGPRGKVGQPNQ